jgi:hypothetical protein
MMSGWRKHGLVADQATNIANEIDKAKRHKSGGYYSKSKYFGDQSQAGHSFVLSSAVAVSSFLSPCGCDKIIKLCEKSHQDACRGIKESSLRWSDRGDYTYSTVDMEVDRHLPLKQWLLKNGFVERLQQEFRQRYGVKIVSFDDMFVVKYSTSCNLDKNSSGRAKYRCSTPDANVSLTMTADDATAASSATQSELRLHVDAGDISFMLALSEGESAVGSAPNYSGGGTFFHRLPARPQTDALQLVDATDLTATHTTGTQSRQLERSVVSATIHMQKGELLTFAAKNQYHAGNAITSGTRYLLVGFSHVERINMGSAAGAGCCPLTVTDLCFAEAGRHPTARTKGNIGTDLTMI